MEDSRPSALETLLRDYPWIVLRFRCHYCQRAGDARLAVLASRYGHLVTLAELLDAFVSRCPWDQHSALRKPQKYGMRCGAYCPDIGRGGPPDLPSGLTVIDGGKGDMLPAEPTHAVPRRRIGAADE